jgi:outer membrane protein OmpA-like peptidoglycan-associated protein
MAVPAPDRRSDRNTSGDAKDAKLKLYVVGLTENVGVLAANISLPKRRAAAVMLSLTDHPAA